MQTFLGQKKRLQRRCQQNICMLSCITIETSSTALSHSSSTLKGDKAQTETSVDKWWWRLSWGSAARLCSLSVPSANTFIHLKNNNKKQKAWFLMHSWSCFFQFTLILCFSLVCLNGWTFFCLNQLNKTSVFCHLDMKQPDKNHFPRWHSLRERGLDMENIITDFSESNPLHFWHHFLQERITCSICSDRVGKLRFD